MTTAHALTIGTTYTVTYTVSTDPRRAAKTVTRTLTLTTDLGVHGGGRVYRFTAVRGARVVIAARDIITAVVA